MACEEGHDDVMKVLIDKGADVNSKDKVIVNVYVGVGCQTIVHYTSYMYILFIYVPAR